MYFTQAIELPTSKKQEMIDVTKRVRAIVSASGIQNGLCSIFCSHTTGAVTLNENTDPDVQTDILNALERAVPQKEKYYKHEEGNAHAHAKAAVLGFSETIPVQGGKLMLGTWQAIYFCEFDGPRNRKLTVTVLGVKALTLAALLGCAHAAAAPASRKIEISEPVVITAGPIEQLPLGEMDDATLFDVGTRAFKAGEFERAALHFDRLWQSFPAAPDKLSALFNAGLSYERLGRFSESLERFDRYLSAKDEPDAQFHAALAEYKLGRLDEAARRLQKLAEQQGLSEMLRADALLQEGVCRVESGARSEGEKLLRAALAIYEKADEAVDPARPAQAEFWLGETYRGYFREVKIDPGAMDEKALGDALENKAQFLLSAQGHYLKAIRKGDGEWATASGYRIGELYEEFHDQLVDAPLPRGLTDDQRALYVEELHKKVRNLISKAMRIYEQTLSTAQRVGAQNDYVQKTEQALDRMRKLLLESEPRG